MTSQGTPQIATIIGRNIAAARDTAELTQRQVAVALELDTRAVGRWERAGIVPSAKNLARLADLLDRDPGWFYTRHPNIDYEKAAA
jgi:transcriptional regulator with XRE-family HTH domain